jgi:hypothetical protein
MILLVAVLAALAVGLVRGGRLESLAHLSLHWGVLALAAFGLQVGAIYVSGDWSDRAWLFPATYFLLLMVAWQNRERPGIVAIGLGLVLNLVVMTANGGLMPITPEAMAQAGYVASSDAVPLRVKLNATKDVALPREETPLWWLSDIFVVPRGLPVRGVFSLGDALIAIGMFRFVQAAMLARPEVDRTRFQTLA